MAPTAAPSTLPNPNGEHVGRNALTGDIGLVANPSGRLNPFVRIGRSYRHPNLEELLFAVALLGDDRAIAATYAAGVQVHQRGE